MRVKKLRLKEMPEKGRECFKLKYGTQICFTRPRADASEEWFYMKRCVGYRPKSKTEKCYTELEGHTEPAARYAYIGHAGTYPEKFRAKGFGGKTFKLLEQFLKERKGIQIIQLHALSTARKYWRRQGFRPIKCSGRGSYPKPCRIGFPEDEEAEWHGQDEAKLLCGYAKDFEGRVIENIYKIDEVHPSASPNVPCYR